MEQAGPSGRTQPASIPDLPSLSFQSVWDQLGPHERAALARTSKAVRALAAPCITSITLSLTRAQRESRSNAHIKRLPSGVALSSITFVPKGKRKANVEDEKAYEASLIACLTESATCRRQPVPWGNAATCKVEHFSVTNALTPWLGLAMPHLRTLHIHDCLVDPAGLPGLLSCPALSTLCLQDVTWGPRDITNTAGAVKAGLNRMQALGNLTNLQHLELQGMQVPTLSWLSSLTSLTDLRLHQCWLSDEGSQGRGKACDWVIMAKQLAVLTQLKHLWVEPKECLMLSGYNRTCVLQDGTLAAAPFPKRAMEVLLAGCRALEELHLGDKTPLNWDAFQLLLGPEEAVEAVGAVAAVGAAGTPAGQPAGAARAWADTQRAAARAAVQGSAGVPVAGQAGTSSGMAAGAAAATAVAAAAGPSQYGPVPLPSMPPAGPSHCGPMLPPNPPASPPHRLPQLSPTPPAGPPHHLRRISAAEVYAPPHSAPSDEEAHLPMAALLGLLGDVDGLPVFQPQSPQLTQPTQPPPLLNRPAPRQCWLAELSLSTPSLTGLRWFLPHALRTRVDIRTLNIWRCDRPALVEEAAHALALHAKHRPVRVARERLSARAAVDEAVEAVDSVGLGLSITWQPGCQTPGMLLWMAYIENRQVLQAATPAMFQDIMSTTLCKNLLTQRLSETHKDCASPSGSPTSSALLMSALRPLQGAAEWLRLRCWELKANQVKALGSLGPALTRLTLDNCSVNSSTWPMLRNQAPSLTSLSILRSCAGVAPTDLAVFVVSAVTPLWVKVDRSVLDEAGQAAVMAVAGAYRGQSVRLQWLDVEDEEDEL